VITLKGVRSSLLRAWMKRGKRGLDTSFLDIIFVFEAAEEWEFWQCELN